MWKAPEKNGSEVRGCASDERIVPLNENDCQPLMKKEPAAADARRTPRILCHSAAQGASTAAAAAPGDGRKGTALSVATAASAAEVRVEMPAPMLDPSTPAPPPAWWPCSNAPSTMCSILGPTPPLPSLLPTPPTTTRCSWIRTLGSRRSRVSAQLILKSFSMHEASDEPRRTMPSSCAPSL